VEVSPRGAKWVEAGVALGLVGAQGKVLPGALFCNHYGRVRRGGGPRISLYSSSGIQRGLLCTNIFTWCEINSHSCYEAGLSGSEHGTRSKDFEVPHPRCVSSIIKKFMYYT